MDPPCDFSICFRSYPIRGVDTKSVFSNYMYTGKGDW